MIQLRPYQIQAIEQLSDGFRKKHKRQILALTTGAGKTVVFSEMVRRAATKGTQTLVLTDRIELFAQTFATLERNGIQPQVVNANSKRFDATALVTVAMIETIKRRRYQFNPSLVIIDEAHRGNFTKIFDYYPDVFFIGATATPVGKHIPKLYTNIVQTIDTPDLIRQGFLSPYVGYQMQDDFSDLRIKGNEYTDESLFAHFHQRKHYDGVIEQWNIYAKGKKTIVFNVNIAHTEAMTEQFNDSGILSYAVTSKTPENERKSILAAFKAGEFMVLNNCGILTTGYDEPSIECVVMNRKTLSLPLWLQCCGRGSRIHSNKTHFTVLDFGMNHSVHGMWDEPRQWTLKEKKKRQQAAPVKECPSCFAMCYASAPVCKVCGHIFPEQKEKKPESGVMVQITPTNLIGKRISELSLEELCELQRRKKYKASFIWRVIRSRGVSQLEKYALMMGYERGWVWNQSNQIENSYFHDYVVK